MVWGAPPVAVLFEWQLSLRDVIHINGVTVNEGSRSG